jgi:hypothetical protein
LSGHISISDPYGFFSASFQTIGRSVLTIVRSSNIYDSDFKFESRSSKDIFDLNELMEVSKLRNTLLYKRYLKLQIGPVHKTEILEVVFHGVRGLSALPIYVLKYSFYIRWFINLKTFNVDVIHLAVEDVIGCRACCLNLSIHLRLSKLVPNSPPTYPKMAPL